MSKESEFVWSNIGEREYASKAIGIACAAGDAEKVRELAEAGEKVNGVVPRNVAGEHPIHVAFWLSSNVGRTLKLWMRQNVLR